MAFWELSIYQRAFLACIMIGFTGGFASAVVLLSRSSLRMAGMSHTLLPGVALASWLVGLSIFSAFVGSTITAVLTGLLTLFLAQRSKLSQDTILVVLFSGAFALGVLVIHFIGQTQELERWLMGNILGMSDLDLWLSFGVGLTVIVFFTLMRRPITISLFEPDVARTLGVPVEALHYLIFTLLIFTLVTTLQAIGGVLTIGLIVTPAATVRQFTHSVSTLLWASGLLGAVGSVLGLLLSYYLDTPAGATIVITFTALFLISFIVKSVLRR